MMPEIAKPGRCVHGLNRSCIDDTAGAVRSNVQDGLRYGGNGSPGWTCPRIRGADQLSGQRLVRRGNGFEIGHAPVVEQNDAESALGRQREYGKLFDGALQIVGSYDPQT